MGAYYEIQMELNLRKLFLNISVLLTLVGTTIVVDSNINTIQAKVSRGKIDNNKQEKDIDTYKKVQGMYKEFSGLIGNNISDEQIRKFFNTYFDIPAITRIFTGLSKTNDKLNNILVRYFAFLLKGNIMQQVKDYHLSEGFSQSNKRSISVIKCNLIGKDNSKIDMSVTLSKKNKKVRDLVFMQSVYIIRGAKNIVDLYCQEHGIKSKNKVDVCETALNEYINKQKNSK